MFQKTMRQVEAGEVMVGVIAISLVTLMVAGVAFPPAVPVAYAVMATTAAAMCIYYRFHG